jgi:hypothetical protein
LREILHLKIEQKLVASQVFFANIAKSLTPDPNTAIFGTISTVLEAEFALHLNGTGIASATGQRVG